MKGNFPHDIGFKLYQGNNADLLMIKLDKLNQCAQAAFKQFLGIDSVALIQNNVGSEKVYAPLYREFKRQIYLPESYIEKMYDSKFTHYFFSDEEILQFRKHWSTRTLHNT